MTRTIRFAYAAAFGLLMLAGAPAAYAQNDISGQNIPSLELDQSDVHDALRALFKNVGANYVVSPDVQGTVTLSLKNVTFETALQNITRQVDATYRIEAGVYQIVKREEPPVTGPVDPGAPTTPKVKNYPRRIQIRHADPQFLAILIGTKNGSQRYNLAPEMSTLSGGGMGSGMMGGMGGGMGGMGGGMGGGMMGGMGGGGMGGGMMGGMGGGGMGGGMMGGGGMGGGIGR